MNSVLEFYSSAKQTLAEFLGASEELLHLHAGMFIFFGTALLFRRRMRSRVPIAFVYVFAVGNELIDVFSPGSAASQLEPLFDILNTVVWPTLLFFLARRRGRSGAPDRTA